MSVEKKPSHIKNKPQTKTRTKNTTKTRTKQKQNMNKTRPKQEFKDQRIHISNKEFHSIQKALNHHPQTDIHTYWSF